MLSLDTFQVYPNTTYSANNLTLRWWYNRDFLDVNDASVIGGSQNFFIEFACTITAGVITVASGNIFTTLDANVQNPTTVQCSAQFFSGSTPKDFLFTNWVVPSESAYPGGVILFDQLTIYNTGANTLANPPTTYFTQAATLAYFNTLVPASTDASALVKGVTKLSVAPVSATDPIALGQNDPAVVTLTDTQVLTNKTLTAPVLTSPAIDTFASALHDHEDAAGGGQLALAAFSSVTGSGAVVGATSPTLVTPVLGVATGTSLALGGGTVVSKIVVYVAALTPSSVAANISSEQTFTVTGLTTADKVFVNGPAPVAGTGIVNCRVSATNTLALTFINTTSGSLAPTAGNYIVVAVRS